MVDFNHSQPCPQYQSLFLCSHLYIYQTAASLYLPHSKLLINHIKKLHVNTHLLCLTKIKIYLSKRRKLYVKRLDRTIPLTHCNHTSKNILKNNAYCHASQKIDKRWTHGYTHTQFRTVCFAILSNLRVSILNFSKKFVTMKPKVKQRNTTHN